ncbi:MAG: methyltransferase family protein [Phycisphaerales bacterium JB039]
MARTPTEARSAELLRWAGSLGVFYILIPAWLIASEPLLALLIPWQPPAIAALLKIALAALGALGIFLIAASIRAQLTRGAGHPFDMTGRESFSRPTQVLLTRGVYWWVRNPMGLGDILLYLAITGLTGSVRSMFINVPLYAAIVWWNHRFNERPALIRRFGEAYRAYERTTSCLLPGPRTTRKLLQRTSPRQGAPSES